MCVGWENRCLDLPQHFLSKVEVYVAVLLCVFKHVNICADIKHPHYY